MAHRPAISQPEDESARVLDGGFWLVVVMAAVCGILVLAVLARGVLTPGGRGSQPGWTAPSSSVAPVDVAAFLYPTPRRASPLELTDQDDRPFSLTTFRGEPTLVFFGYTHCPDVCPATVGTMGLAMGAFGPGVHATFVTVDPARDTPAWLKEYVRYLPAGFVALTGSADQVRAAADAWGVRYARVEGATPDTYSMSHTADVFLVDATGALRARFPFGTEAPAMTAVLHEVVATTTLAVPSADAGATATPTPAAIAIPIATSAPSETLHVAVVSSSVWAGHSSPVILMLSTGATPLNDPSLHPAVQLQDALGAPVGDPVDAVPVQPPGVVTVSYVAELTIPSPSVWRLVVSANRGGAAVAGSAALTALDPGTTAAIGTLAPIAHTPTLADVGGNPRAVTTDPAPDLRLSGTSTTDALASGQPFVLVVDSTRFRVSPACGRAIIMARYLLDRWRDVAFIHLEPYRYSVVTDTPLLDGSLDHPMLTDPAAAWGIGGAPWGPRSMPWVFVVDGHGVVRAKYQGVMGSADVDVIIALIERGG